MTTALIREMSCNLGTWFALLCVYLAFETIQGQDTRIIVEPGTSTTLECPLMSTGTPISWVIVSNGQHIPVSTCEVGKHCVGNHDPQYTVQMTSTYGTHVSTLQIASVRKTETHFACIVGSQISHFVLGVYVLPTTPSCSLDVYKQGDNVYADFTCRTDHVYPAFKANISRTEGVIRKIDNASECHTIVRNSSQTDDYIGICKFRIPGSELLETNTLYINMYVMVFNDTEVYKPPLVSLGYTFTIGLPRVRLPSLFCPVGPGVRGEYILNTTIATCKCELTPGQLVPGRARWYRRDGTVTGREDPDGKFSILTIFYNQFDPNQMYDCRADNPTASYYHVKYYPKFTSSAPGEFTVGLSFLMFPCAVIISLI